MTTRRTRIQPVELFETPKDWKELMTWVSAFCPSDQPHLITAAMMAWNLACKFTNEKPKRTLRPIISIKKVLKG